MVNMIIYIILCLITFIFIYIIICKVSKLFDKIDKNLKFDTSHNENINEKEFIFNEKKENKQNKEKEKLPEYLTDLGFVKYTDDIDEIKQRYLKLSKIYHPDNGGSQEEFQKINDAYKEAQLLLSYKKK